ncbi:MAG TPA: hypothetical protein VFF80_02355 [Bacillota bacterium]|nr:hypothetical protein [Bacillota bacterium]
MQDHVLQLNQAIAAMKLLAANIMLQSSIACYLAFSMYGILKRSILPC